MSRGIQRFKLTEIKRLLRAAKAEGVDVVRVKVGDVEIEMGKPAETAPVEPSELEF